jgi:hypothetical protein
VEEHLPNTEFKHSTAKKKKLENNILVSYKKKETMENQEVPRNGNAMTNKSMKKRPPY